MKRSLTQALLVCAAVLLSIAPAHGEETEEQIRAHLDGMAHIPGGWFTMGDANDGDPWEDAPLVKVFVSGFFLARTPVSWDLWDEVRDWALQHGYTDLARGRRKEERYPVTEISWWDAVKWLNARSEREGLAPVYRNADGTVFKTGTVAPTPDWTADGYRLPTEAEWEKAARGGVAGPRFPWGNEITHREANFTICSGHEFDSMIRRRGQHPAFSRSAGPPTSAAGSFAPNRFGIHDMAGNVWEWTWDWYSDTSYTDGARDPKGASTGTARVLRGGSWRSGAFFNRTAYRNHIPPANRRNNIGFRAARGAVHGAEAIQE